MSKIHFGTNRNPIPSRNPRRFGTKLNGDAPAMLRFGCAHIEGGTIKLEVFPENLKPTASKFDTDESKSILGSHSVFANLRDDMTQNERDTLIFIHGFNVSFNGGIRAASSMVQNFSGKEIDNATGINVSLFSWPSDGLMVPWLSYASDRRDAAASGPAFARGLLKISQFLRSLRGRDACNQRVHLLAHSMGNYVLRNALQTMISETAGRLPNLFHHIFLVAPDEDDDAFEVDYKLRRLPEIGKWIHVYFNRQDTALSISDRTKGNPGRLGADGARLPFQLPGRVTQVDCTRVVHGVVEHSYYLETPAVVNDIAAVLSGTDAHEIPDRKFLRDRNCYQLKGKAK